MGACTATLSCSPPRVQRHAYDRGRLDDLACGGVPRGSRESKDLSLPNVEAGALVHVCGAWNKKNGDGGLGWVDTHRKGSVEELCCCLPQCERGSITGEVSAKQLTRGVSRESREGSQRMTSHTTQCFDTRGGMQTCMHYREDFHIVVNSLRQSASFKVIMDLTTMPVLPHHPS